MFPGCWNLHLCAILCFHLCFCGYGWVILYVFCCGWYVVDVFVIHFYSLSMKQFLLLLLLLLLLFFCVFLYVFCSLRRCFFYSRCVRIHVVAELENWCFVINCIALVCVLCFCSVNCFCLVRWYIYVTCVFLAYGLVHLTG